MDEDGSRLETLLFRFRWQIILLLLGLSFLGGGIYLTRSIDFKSHEIEVISTDEETAQDSIKIIVEVSGAVNSPGVFEIPGGSRVEDALSLAGDVSSRANNDWVSKVINRASILSDGQKIYIPFEDEQLNSQSANTVLGDQTTSSGDSGLLSARIDINTASSQELEALWGIGPKTAENIIEQRPYSSVEELLTKKILKQNVYDANKDLLSVY